MKLIDCLLFATFFVAVVVHGKAKTMVPAIYVFGDSLADVGNNNYLNGSTVPKANYPPYGIDLPNRRPTGRFSNGYNGIDFLAMRMGFRGSPPAYLSLTKKSNHQIWKGLRGINFASGQSGILDSTGVTITMTRQVQYFAKFRSDLATRIGTDSSTNLLSESIFIISSGSNDIPALMAKNITKEPMIETLMSTFSEHLKTLYNLGARKFLIWNVGLIGCCPGARARNPSGGCNDRLDDLTVGFNKELNGLMKNLSSWQGMKYSIANTYEFTQSLMQHPSYQGYTDVKSACCHCCGSGILNAEIRCNQTTSYCTDRGNYLFWDMVHLSEATSKKYAMAIFSGHQQFVSPINVMQLIKAEGNCGVRMSIYKSDGLSMSI